MDHVGCEEFRMVNWLPTKQRVDQCLLMCLYNFDKGKSPQYMEDIFKKFLPVRFTRGSVDSYFRPKFRLKCARNSISFLAPSLWNTLPVEIKFINNSFSFKHSIKKFYLSGI